MCLELLEFKSVWGAYQPAGPWPCYGVLAPATWRGVAWGAFLVEGESLGVLNKSLGICKESIRNI